MKVIVDANIIFSGILNTDGKIGDLLINSSGIIDFFSPDYMHYELRKYFEKLSNLSGKPNDTIARIFLRLTRNINFIPENKIPPANKHKAYKICADIDPKDSPYIALSEFLRMRIWTGDKKLRKGLSEKGLDITVNTDDLYFYIKKFRK